MICNINVIYCLLLFLLLWGTDQVNAWVEIEVDACGEFSTPYAYYNQVRTLLLTGGTSNTACVTISGEHSFYNGNRFKIRSINKLGYGINILAGNVTVSNTDVDSVEVGLLFSNSLATASNNLIGDCTKTGIRVYGSEANVTSNVIKHMRGSALQAIHVSGPTATIYNNTLDDIVGMPVAGIFFSSSGTVNISNNQILSVTTPYDIGTCINWFDASIGGIVVNISQSVTIQNNLISNIGGGGCSNPMATVALGIFTSSISGTSSPVIINNNNIDIKGSGLLGQAVGIYCIDNSGGRATFPVKISNTTIMNLQVGLTIADAIGIKSQGCNILSLSNTIHNLTGTGAYGIQGKGYQSFSILDNKISELKGFLNYSVGVVIDLNEAGTSGGLQIFNNQLKNVDYSYHFRNPNIVNDVCGGVNRYTTSNATCFPPGQNCCAADCTRLCVECDSKCGATTGTNFTYTCGDGVCDSSENCTTCSADCSCGAECGDKICSTDQGENCTSCPSDCGCVSVCPVNCSGHGTCEENNICVCDGDYAGPTCDRITVDFDFDIDTVLPGTVISYDVGDTTYTYNVSLSLIREVRRDGAVVKSIELTKELFESVPLSFNSFSLFPNSTLFKNVLAVLPNGAKILFTLFDIPQRTKLSFGKSKVSIPPKSIKINVQIWDWPFLSVFNQIEIYTNQYSVNNEIGTVGYLEDDYGNVRAQEITTAHNSSLFINVAPFSIVDGFLRRMQVRKTDKGVAVVLPFFLFRAIYDPDFSVLVGNSNNNNGPDDDQSSKSGNDIDVVAVVVGIAVSVSLVIFIAVFIKIIYPKLKERHTVNDAKKRKSLSNVY